VWISETADMSLTYQSGTGAIRTAGTSYFQLLVRTVHQVVKGFAICGLSSGHVWCLTPWYKGAVDNYSAGQDIPDFFLVTKLIYRVIQKEYLHFQKFILQVLLDIGRHAIYRLKGELLKLFSHLKGTRCEPHVWCGRCQIDNPALPTLVAACHR
jgi:hypothetical protein